MSEKISSDNFFKEESLPDENNVKIIKEGYKKEGKLIGTFKKFKSQHFLYEKSEFNKFSEKISKRTYFSNGNIKSHEKYGSYGVPYELKEYDAEGNLIGEGSKYEGEYKEYFKKGNLKRTVTYQNYAEVGGFSSFYENGNLKEKGSNKYGEGTVDGLYELYYSTGTKWKSGTYLNGYKHGDYEEYYPSGKLKISCAYKISDNRITNYGQYDFYEGDNGWKSEECGEVVFEKYDDSQFLTGEYKEYYESGTLKKVCTYKNGCQNGQCIEYYENGGINIISTMEAVHFPSQPYKNFYERAIGVKEEFYKNGQLESRKKFKSINLSEVITEFTDSGRLKRSDYKYLQYVKDGLYKSYHYDGKVKEEFEYKNGDKSGVWKEYFEDGKIKSESEYKDGKLIGTQKKYYETGALKAQWVYFEEEQKFDYYYGYGKSFYPNGILKSVSLLGEYWSNGYERKDSIGVKENDINGQTVYETDEYDQLIDKIKFL